MLAHPGLAGSGSFHSVKCLFLKAYSMPPLLSAQIRELRARAHGLNPVVSISENGLTDAVLKEIDVSLKAHELIKIRVYGDSRENRLSYLERICSELAATAVQHIGKLLIVYRENPENSAVDRKKAQKSRSSEPRRTKRSHQG
jgi:putative YhbY family RNA-binding protein